MRPWLSEVLSAAATAPVQSHPEAFPFVCAAGVCWIGCFVCWLSALGTKPPHVYWMDGKLWMKLPPEGKRLRNRGILFFVGAWAFGAIGIAVTKF
jgi:hypothetical protein